MRSWKVTPSFWTWILVTQNFSPATNLRVFVPSAPPPRLAFPSLFRTLIDPPWVTSTVLIVVGCGDRQIHRAHLQVVLLQHQHGTRRHDVGAVRSRFRRADRRSPVLLQIGTLRAGDGRHSDEGQDETGTQDTDGSHDKPFPYDIRRYARAGFLLGLRAV